MRFESHFQAIVKDPPCAKRTSHRPGIALAAPIKTDCSLASRAGPSTKCSGGFHCYTYRGIAWDHPWHPPWKFAGISMALSRYLPGINQSATRHLRLNPPHSRPCLGPVRAVLDKPGSTVPSRLREIIRIHPHRLGTRTNLKKVSSLACLYPPNTRRAYPI
jgi:hypothetical protein